MTDNLPTTTSSCRFVIDDLVDVQPLLVKGLACAPTGVHELIHALETLASSYRSDILRSVETQFQVLRLIEKTILELKAEDGVYAEEDIAAYELGFTSRCELLIRQCNVEALRALDVGSLEIAGQLCHAAKALCYSTRLPLERQKVLQHLTQSNLGCFYHQRGQLDRACRVTCQAVEWMEDQPIVSRCVEEHATTYGNLAIIYSQLGKHKLALATAMKAYEVLTEDTAGKEELDACVSLSESVMLVLLDRDPAGREKMKDDRSVETPNGRGLTLFKRYSRDIHKGHESTRNDELFPTSISDPIDFNDASRRGGTCAVGPI